MADASGGKRSGKGKVLRFDRQVRALVLSEVEKERIKFSEKVFLNFPYKIAVPLGGHLPIPSASIVKKIRAMALFREEQQLLNFLWNEAVETGRYRVELSAVEIADRTGLPPRFIFDTLKKKFPDYQLITLL